LSVSVEEGASRRGFYGKEGKGENQLRVQKPDQVTRRLVRAIAAEEAEGGEDPNRDGAG